VKGLDMPIMTRTPGGEEIVILSRKEYDRLTAKAEDTADIRKGKSIMRRVRAGDEDTLSSDEVKALIAAKTPLALWRKKRGLTQATLAEETGIAQGFLSEIEAGKKTGDVKTLRKVAAALRVTLDDLAA